MSPSTTDAQAAAVASLAEEAGKLADLMEAAGYTLYDNAPYSTGTGTFTRRNTVVIYEPGSHFPDGEDDPVTQVTAQIPYTSPAGKSGTVLMTEDW